MKPMITPDHIAQPDSIRALIAEANVAQPGDVVVLNYPTLLSKAQMEAIKEGLDHVRDCGIKFLVIAGGVQVTIARNGESVE